MSYPNLDLTGEQPQSRETPTMKYVRRFVFVHFDDLLELRFKQLEKVTDKLYVFVPDSVQQVPLHLVRQMQKMGPDLDWIEVGDVSPAAALSILSFHIGVLHEKVDLGVEFAILSDDDDLDSLVAYIDAAGRACVRVKQRGTAGPSSTEELDQAEQHNGPLARERSLVHRRDELDRDAEPSDDREQATTAIKSLLSLDDFEDLDEEEAPTARSRMQDLPEGFGDYKAFVTATAREAGTQTNGKSTANDNQRSPSTTPTEGFDAKPLADDLVRRLIRSGNRPADLSMLRSYILLHTDDAAAARNVDGIIQQMVDNGEVRVRDGQVAYSF